MATSNQSDFWDDVTQTVQKATENVKQAGQRAYDTIDNATGGAVSRAVDTVKQAGQRAYNTVNDATGGRLDKAVGAAQEFFENPDPFINPYHNNSGRFMRDVENAQAQRDNDDNTYTDRFGRKVPFEEGKYYRSGDNYFLWQDGKKTPVDHNLEEDFRRQRRSRDAKRRIDMKAEYDDANYKSYLDAEKGYTQSDSIRDNAYKNADNMSDDEFGRAITEAERVDARTRQQWDNDIDSLDNRYAFRTNGNPEGYEVDEDHINPNLHAYLGRDGRYHSYEEGKTYRDADGNTFIWQNNRPVLKDQDITVNIDKAQRARYKKAQGSNTKTASFVRYKILDNQEQEGHVYGDRMQDGTTKLYRISNGQRVPLTDEEAQRFKEQQASENAKTANRDIEALQKERNRKREGHVYGEKLKGGQTRLYRISGGERVYLDPDEYNRYGVEFQPE